MRGFVIVMLIIGGAMVVMQAGWAGALCVAAAALCWWVA